MSLSKRNRRGVIALVVIGALLMFVPRVLTSLQKEVNLNVSYEDVMEFEDEVSKASSRQKGNSSHSSKKKKKFQIPNRAFDPNDYTVEEWEKLGLSRKQAEVIQRFTSRGVSSDEQLKRIYVLPEDLFKLIEDSTFYANKKAKKTRDKEVRPKIDINTANRNELMSLNGIGPYYADKIISYREDLGGYISDVQLLEIWKFDSEKLENIRSRIFVSKEDVHLINVNDATIEMLKKHPYISYNVANSIVKMRASNGTYKKVSEIRMSKLIDEELFEKIHPYLTTE